MTNKKEEVESPYCKECNGCGEEGCCSPINCNQLMGGKYCKTYLSDLKFAYLMYQDTYVFLKDDDESKKKIKEIFDKNYNLIYK